MTGQRGLGSSSDSAGVPARATGGVARDARARVGFIGLGVMGAPMAGHLVRGLGEGSLVAVSSHRRASAEAALAAGARWCPTPREVAATTDVVVLMVPGMPAVHDLLAGPDGLLAGVAEDRTVPLVLVVSSSTAPEEVRELGAELDRRTHGRVHVVDAPVSGGEEGAVAGTLSILVGGERADTDRVVPLLRTMGTPTVLGPLGSGQIAKACNQMIVGATVTTLAEASLVAERAGLDVAALFSALAGGYAGSRLMDVKAARLAAHDYSPSGPARFLARDLGAAAHEAARTGTVTPELDAVRSVFRALVEAGLGDEDSAVVQGYLAGLAPAGAGTGTGHAAG